MKRISMTSLLLVVALTVFGQYKSKITSKPKEKWWGGFVGIGSQMPFESSTKEFDLSKENFNNQNVPLLVSSQGRYVWSEQPFKFKFKNDTLLIDSKYELITVNNSVGNTLREAYLTASKKHFPPTNKIPAEEFFSKPQYNTWIELMYNQNQTDIMHYANQIIKNNFPTGVFMIDDNWQKYYGNFDFKPEKFSDPEQMVKELHQMGFKVMLWVCPFVTPDSPEFRELEKRGFLLKERGSHATAIIRWWNGYSACYDMTNPKAAQHFKNQLNKLQSEFGIDGFKLDAGDVSYMKGDYDFYEESANVNTFSQRWAEVGLDYSFNELRTSWKLGGTELVQRLGDKDYSWEAATLLIPDITTAGILGHIYTCPDLIGGGQFSSFLTIDSNSFDQELIVRSCQIHTMMPMMQFSVAPWRILDKKHMDICATFAHLHEEMGDYILELAHQASLTSEPIVRNMEYAFPHQGYINCRDQFMLGDKYLVAPMITKGNKRKVKLPKGRWVDELGVNYKGGKTIEIEVPIDRLPYFIRKQKNN